MSREVINTKCKNIKKLTKKQINKHKSKNTEKCLGDSVGGWVSKDVINIKCNRHTNK